MTTALSSTTLVSSHLGEKASNFVKTNATYTAPFDHGHLNCPSKRLPADVYSRKCTVLKVDGATSTFGVLVMGHDKPIYYIHGSGDRHLPGIYDPILTNKKEVETLGFPEPYDSRPIEVCAIALPSD